MALREGVKLSHSVKRPRSGLPQGGSGKGAAVKRASVVECARPSGAVAQGESCQPAGEWIFPSHSSRKDAARVNEPWLLRCRRRTCSKAVEGHRTPTTLARWASTPRSRRAVVRARLGRCDTILSQLSPNHTTRNERPLPPRPAQLATGRNTRTSQRPRRPRTSRDEFGPSSSRLFEIGYLAVRALATASSNSSPRRSLPMILPSGPISRAKGMASTPYLPAS